MTDDLLRLLARFAEGDPSVVGELRAAMAEIGLDPELVQQPGDATLVAELLASGTGALEGLALSTDVSDGVMAHVAPGAAQVPVGEAVRAAAGALEGVDGRWAGVERHVAPAVREAAGPVEAWPGLARELGVAQALPVGVLLSAMLDNALTGADRERGIVLLTKDPAAGPTMTRLADLGRWLREAIRQASGTPLPMWGDVAPHIGVTDPEEVPGWDGAWMASQLRAGAGSVDVTDAVMAALRVDLAEPEALPEVANTVSWSVLGGLAAAAAVLLGVVWSAQAPVVREVTLPPMVMEFASAGEVNVDRIHSAAEASVFVEVPSGVGGPLIIWIDEPGGG